MARAVLLTGLAVLLGGCADPAALPPSDEGWKAAAGLDGVVFRGRWLGCEATCDFEATVKNDGSSTYRINDSCAGRWHDWAVRDASGGLLTPSHGAACDMCDPGLPFPPGAQRTAVWRWGRTDLRESPRDGPGTAAAQGSYVATLDVVLGRATEPDCGPDRAFTSGPYNVTFGL